MKIYTKTGDKGMTSLYGGRRISKSDIRIDAYGTVDELNSFIGLLMAYLPEGHSELPLLIEIQKRLFTIGSNLAQDPEKALSVPDLLDSDIDLLENAIDNMNANIEPLRSFILPGGTKSSSYAHVCRTITRRSERNVILLMKDEEVSEILVKYLNRLSDYFFVLARLLNKEMRVPDIPWMPR